MFFKILKKFFIQFVSAFVFLLVLFVAVSASQGVSYDFASGSFERVSVLDVSSFPQGAQIFIDGVYQNEETPAKILSVPVGKHKITLKKSGFLSWEKVLNFDKDKATKTEEIFLFPINLERLELKKHGRLVLDYSGKNISQINDKLKTKKILEKEGADWSFVSLEEVKIPNSRTEIIHPEKKVLEIRGNELWKKVNQNEKLRIKKFSRKIKKAKVVNSKYILVLLTGIPQQNSSSVLKSFPSNTSSPRSSNIPVLTNSTSSSSNHNLLESSKTDSLAGAKDLIICDNYAKNCHTLGRKIQDFSTSGNGQVVAASQDDQILVWDFSVYEEKYFLGIF